MTGLTPAQLRGSKVLILGVGVLNGGLQMALYCHRHGADVRVTDLRPQEILGSNIQLLAKEGIAMTLGEHRLEDVEWSDIVIRNPGVLPGNPYLARAIELGKTVDMELAFFVRNAPSRVFGVSGTKGKTTVTSMFHSLLQSDGNQVHLAGNMGRSAIALLDDLKPSDDVLVELSSYQLEGFETDPGRFEVAILTNIDDDHLDRYGGFARYEQVKGYITAGQTSEDWIVFPGADLHVIEAIAGAAARRAALWTRNERPEYPEHSCDLNVYLADDSVLGLFGDGRRVEIASIEGLGLPGAHNRINAALASVAAYLVGVPSATITAGIPKLRGVRYRFESVATVGDIEFINDTAATAPIAVKAAIEALGARRATLIAGGHDKAANYAPMIETIIANDVDVVLLPGSGTDRIVAALKQASPGHSVVIVPSMPAAVATAYDRARVQGRQAVLLSPGCASFGLFVNEFDRGDQFADAAREIASAP